MYPGCLGDWYAGLDTQILAPKKNFLSFLFSVALQQKYAEYQSMISQWV